MPPLNPEEVFAWSAWEPLQGCQRRDTVPALAGLYRIHRAGHDDLDYIGQTGAGTMNLRKRLAMLSGVFAKEMPYRDPHMAGPALWALRHATGKTLEVSVMPVEGSTQWRKGLEALAISLYRQAHGQSPNVNFGRMPLGYKASSHNNSRLVAQGKRYRGGPSTEIDDSHGPSIAPKGPLTGEPQAADWCGHTWSAWVPMQALPASARGVGLYRIRAASRAGLLYVGQGNIAARLAAHLAKVDNPNHRQGRILAEAGGLERSWVQCRRLSLQQLLEWENDLIAAHVLVTGEAPPAQFLG